MKAWEDFKFGLFMGMGLCVAYGVLHLIVAVLNHLVQSAPNLKL